MKDAMMTGFYGSKVQPALLFTVSDKERPKWIKAIKEDPMNTIMELLARTSPQLTAYYKAVKSIAPGAYELLNDLLNAWQPFAKIHQWQLPDGFEAKIKVVKQISGTSRNRIEIDELDHATFTYVWYENQGSEKGISLAAK